MSVRLRFAILVLVVLAPTLIAARSDLVDLVVHTQAGAVRGVTDGGVDGWLGVPYAAPPVGDLRWRPPVPVMPWSGIRDASEPGPACIQLSPSGGTNGSEDCLHVNVFAPASATPGSGLAVMVHLHPGSNTFGRAYLHGSSLVARGIVLVTVDYRLGVFGFVGHPALSKEGGGSSGEYGVLDQLAALQWVHDNIAAFGGDPTRVTLFGSSAGSFDTAAIMASPLSPGLIGAAAVQADVFWGLTGALNTIDFSERIGPKIAHGVGCGSGPDVLTCLRATSASQLVETLGFADFAPWVGGVVLPRSPLDLIAHRPGVPLLVGFDREEDAAFTLPLPHPYPRWRLEKDAIDLLGPAYAERALALYPQREYASRQWSFVTMRTDAVRGCPTRRLANAVQAPVWRWLYTHTYENDPFLARFRASHVLEDPFIWGNFDLFQLGYTPTPAEVALSRQIVTYWTNFAKTGDPNGAGLPAWPRYDTSTEPTLTLDDTIGVVTGYHVAQCALLDRIPVPFPRTGQAGEPGAYPAFVRRG